MKALHRYPIRPAFGRLHALARTVGGPIGELVAALEAPG